MKRSFQAFMEGLIDYAGLFPPARLDLDGALDEYSRHRRGPHAWMLGRFILPAARLHELDPEGDARFAPDSPFRLSAILASAPEEAESLNILKREAEGIKAFHDRHQEYARVEVLETRFPEATLLSPAAERWAAYLLGLKAGLEKAGLEGMQLFAEIPDHALDGRIVDESAIAGIASFHKAFPKGTLVRTGFKLRCGGLEPAAFPSVERVARVIFACREKGAAFKCTAGLHHPLRHRSPETGAQHHGFFNVFGAALLALGGDMPLEKIEACLCEEDGGAFRFEEDALTWRGFSVSTDTIRAFRRELVAGFGSCSFVEPLEDLAALGLLT